MPKLNTADRLEVFCRLNQGEKGRDLAREFGLCPASVSRIKNQFTRSLPGKAMEVLARKADKCPGCGHKVYIWPCLQCLNQPNTRIAGHNPKGR